MKYCPSCGSEYRDDVTACAQCGGKALVASEESHRRGKLLPGEENRRRFARVGSAEDPLTLEHLSGVIKAAHIPVLSQYHGSVLDPITSPAGPWWEILVPEEYSAKATELIARERSRMAAGADEAARAAEEEEAETEKRGGPVK